MTPSSFLVLLALLLVSPTVTAQSSTVAAPYYGPEAFAAAATAHFGAPLSARFDRAASALAARMTSACGRGGSLDAAGRGAARDAWLSAANAWEALDAVAQGPTLTRRSARSIDFRPVRPRLIVAAIKTHGQGAMPPTMADLERVGSPAKGLPALEWLLWDTAAPGDAASCRYAVGVAGQVAAEASALAREHAADAARPWADEGEAAAARSAEIVNQWLGGLEALRWRQLGKPLAIRETTEAAASDPHKDIWPRPPSATHRDAWRARWDVLRSLAVGPAPTNGFGRQPAVPPAVVSLEALLRGRGLADAADGWASRTATAERAMAALMVPAGPTAATAATAALPSPAVMQAAVDALGALRAFMQDQLAPALKIALGFSDADGD